MSAPTTNPTDFLMGSGTTSAKFDTIGDTITGTIIDTKVVQQTDLASGDALTWENGDPRYQLVVTLQTDERDPLKDDDDGKRNLYIKGSKAAGSKSLHDAVRTAAQTAGVKAIEEGGTLTVTFVGEEPSKTRGFNPRKLYEATYQAPDKAAAAGEFLGTTPAPATAASVPVGQQLPIPAPAPAAPGAGGVTPAEQVKQLLAAGLDHTKIAAALGLDPTVVQVLANQ